MHYLCYSNSRAHDTVLLGSKMQRRHRENLATTAFSVVKQRYRYRYDCINSGICFGGDGRIRPPDGVTRQLISREGYSPIQSRKVILFCFKYSVLQQSRTFYSNTRKYSFGIQLHTGTIWAPCLSKQIAVLSKSSGLWYERR